MEKYAIYTYSFIDAPVEGDLTIGNTVTRPESSDKHRRAMLDHLFGKQNKNGREQLAQPYVFIKCFTQSIDYLPMWKMYGDDAKGCCIVVDWNRTKQLNEEKEIALYKVCYLRRKKGDYFFVKSDNGNDKVLDDLGVLLEQLKKNVVELRKIE